MNDKSEISTLPGYVTSEQAAQMLGVSKDRLYQYIRQKRIPALSIGKSYLMRIEDIEQFQRNPTGRSRKNQASWRSYKDGITIIATEITVQIREGQQQNLLEKLQSIQRGNEYIFPGTVARYIMQDQERPDQISILLFWKSSDLPSEEKRQASLAAFQAKTADILNWETARITLRQALLHT